VKIEFNPEALAEYKDAAQYYASRQENLELRFIAAVEAVLDRIQQNPESGRIFEADIRRRLTRVFPYAILYSIDPAICSSLPSCTAIANRATGIIV
jgi:plasmid stabilization system protein ParE